jgi:thiamine transport system ATP-binding protein
MLELEKVRVAFGSTVALGGVTLAAGAAETVAVLGPSGCGKTTLLRVAAGLQAPDEGRVLLEGNDVTGVPPHRRGVGLMFQDNVLFPHRDVAGNVGFGLRMARLPRREIEQRVRELLELVGLPGVEQRSVRTLSGGEQQRVALARALAPEPRALLLDEPLGSLDGPLRERLLGDLRALFQRLSLTVLYVTHDVGEAFALGHRVAVVRAGRLVQAGTPEEVWRTPADAWVARFLGMRNVRERDGRSVVVRPEAVRLAPGDGAVVVDAERRGALVWLRVRLDTGEELDAATAATSHPAVGGRVAVAIDPDGVVELPSWKDALP